MAKQAISFPPKEPKKEFKVIAVYRDVYDRVGKLSKDLKVSRTKIASRLIDEALEKYE